MLLECLFPIALACMDMCHPDCQSSMLEEYEVTAYTNSPDECWPFYDGKTAMGTPADWRRGIVAVDPARIPLGSDVWIEGLGWFLAEDTGGSIKGRRIDVLMGSKRDAFRWGRRTVLVRVG